ncbi:hypothetical protein RQP46_002215 [Phenoliferia psychrophenolica]
MSSTIPSQYTGYGAKDEASGKRLDLEQITYTPKVWSENDVDIKISHCGMCGSDFHTLSNGWAPVMNTEYPCIAGHESKLKSLLAVASEMLTLPSQPVVGTVVRAGSKSGLALGTRVGVGAQAGSDLGCEYCDLKKENYCSNVIMTYQGKWEDGSTSQGGYADFVRCQGRFAIPIPAEISSAEAAPLLCAGVTTYAPLKRFGCGPGKKVGVVGIGGLGHLALQWAAAMGAETFALSHSDSKIADATKLGVKPESFIVAKDTAATAAKYEKTLDILILTSSHIGPLEELYFPLLRHEGTLVLLGVPEEKLPAFYGQSLIFKNLSVHGSFIGSTNEIRDMFALAASSGVRPWIQVRPMSDASQAAKDAENGLARYRYVLETDSASA